MTNVVNYMACPRTGSSGTITEDPTGTLTMMHKTGQPSTEVFAQWAGIPIPEPGVWVIAGRCRQVTLPDSGKQNLYNGCLPVWPENLSRWSISGFSTTLEAKDYAVEFTAPENTKTLMWRVCAPSEGGAVWDQLWMGTKKDWLQLQALGMQFDRQTPRPLIFGS